MKLTWKVLWGGGSLFFAKPLAQKNVINDKNKSLINFYKNIKNSNTNLNNCELPKNEKEFDQAIKNKNPSVCSFLKINKRSYGCKMDITKFSPSKVPKNNPKQGGIENIQKSYQDYKNKLKNTTILNQDFEKVMKNYDSEETFHYLDPPYVDTYDYGQEKVSPERVCAVAKKMKGKVLLSYNNHPRVRKSCKGLKFKKVDTKYELQKSNTGKSKPVKELLIKNY